MPTALWLPKDEVKDHLRIAKGSAHLRRRRCALSAHATEASTELAIRAGSRLSLRKRQEQSVGLGAGEQVRAEDASEASTRGNC